MQKHKKGNIFDRTLQIKMFLVEAHFREYGWFVGWRQKRVCVPGLVLLETRQDETGGHLPNWRDYGKTTYVWPHCSVNLGKNLGGDRITQYHQGKVV